MLEADAYSILERDKPEMGMNYLIAGGIVYGVMMWAMGGVCFRQTWRPGDADYEVRYRNAANNPHTLFMAAPEH